MNEFIRYQNHFNTISTKLNILQIISFNLTLYWQIYTHIIFLKMPSYTYFPFVSNIMENYSLIPFRVKDIKSQINLWKYVFFSKILFKDTASLLEIVVLTIRILSMEYMESFANLTLIRCILIFQTSFRS